MERDLNKFWWDDLKEDEFREMFHMNKQTVIHLQAEIDHSEKTFEDRIDPALLACLWFLGNMKAVEEAKPLFGLDDLNVPIKEYLLKLLRLGSDYIYWPSLEELQLLENSFCSQYQLSGAVGVVGSLLLETNANDEPNKQLYNNKFVDKQTVILQVVCDSNCLLRDVCVGFPGGKSVQEVLEFSPLYKYLIDQDGALIKNNFYLLGGTELTDLKTLITPYKFLGKDLTPEQHQYNLVHESVMSLVEKTFKCLKNRFPRLTSVETPQFTTLIVSCICILHNFTLVYNDCYKS